MIKITLKNVKHSEFASHETNCFQATVYVDGKPFCGAENSGQGGGDNYFPLKGGKHNELSKRIAEIDLNLLKELGEHDTIVSPFNSFSSPKKTFEYMVGDALTEWLVSKDLKKLLAKRVVWVADGKLLQTQAAKSTAIKDRWMNEIINEKTTDEVLNMLPFDKAISVYAELTQ